MEDAALLRPESGPGLVFTVDFITPIVDSPEDFGAIAVANALSDVYAMGGVPQVALAICGFPGDPVPKEVLGRIFRGGRDKAAEAGCAIVGGHTVIDPELKYGLCVVGSVDADRALTQDRARPGDRLVLTKPLGTGIAAQAIKTDRLSATDTERVVASMKELNREAGRIAMQSGVRAATDVTGFGLLGHLHHLAAASGCSARIGAASVPVFDFTHDLARQGVVPGGTAKNLAYVADTSEFDAAVDEPTRLVLADAQTSGGLLLAVDPADEANLVAALEAAGVPVAASIGEFEEGDPGRLRIEA
jgi:selenide,water dikinase